jgi:WhiB family redox-sensing transcriptional regulator
MSEKGPNKATASTYQLLMRASHNRHHWRADAACCDADPDLFFPDDTHSAAVKVRLAKLICGGCLVSATCLSWALAGREAGVWGGMTEEERRRLHVPSASSS